MEWTKPGDEVELFWLFEQNGGTVGRTLYSFHSEILSKNNIWGIFADLSRPLFAKFPENDALSM